MTKDKPDAKVEPIQPSKGEAEATQARLDKKPRDQAANADPNNHDDDLSKIPQALPTEHLDGEDNNRGPGDEKRNKNSKPWVSADWATVWIGIVGIPVLVYQSCLTRDSNDYTRRAIELAEKQDREAAETSKEDRALNLKIAKAAEDNAKAAQSNVHTIRENLRLEQRAWVGFVEAKAQDVAVGSTGSFSASFRNTGRTPALKVHTRLVMRPIKRGVAFVPSYRELDTVPSNPVLVPNGLATLSEPWIAKFTEADIAALKDGSVRFYLYGRFSYVDIFRCRHSGTFCTFLDEDDLKTLRACGFYNTLGPDACPPGDATTIPKVSPAPTPTDGN